MYYALVDDYGGFGREREEGAGFIPWLDGCIEKIQEQEIIGMLETTAPHEPSLLIARGSPSVVSACRVCGRDTWILTVVFQASLAELGSMMVE